VRNLSDGRVEAMVAGDAAQVDAILAWSRVGPAGGSVEKLIVESATGEFADFELRATV
jgi:acylphosphatase